jgi:hypothetical protein
VITKAAEYGFSSTADGKMIKPDNFDELNERLLDEMYNA